MNKAKYFLLNGETIKMSEAIDNIVDFSKTTISTFQKDFIIDKLLFDWENYPKDLENILDRGHVTSAVFNIWAYYKTLLIKLDVEKYKSYMQPVILD